MQGVILSAGIAQGIILGDNGARYSFTPAGWQDQAVGPQVGMRVDFEARGSQAVAIHPIPGTAPPPPSSPPSQSGQVPATGFPPQTVPPGQQSIAPASVPSTSPGSPAAEPAPPSRWKFGTRPWHWAAAGGGLLVVILLVVGAFFLGLFGSSGPPVGKEIARQTYEGSTYVLVEYGDELTIFSESGAPVGQSELAEEILRSYAWRQVLEDFDIEELTSISQEVERLDEDVSDVRDLSNSVVSMFDRLDSMEARVPLLGSVSAMDVVRESFSGVSDAESVIRSLDSELNALGQNSSTLAGASGRISTANPASVSGREMEALFPEAAGAAEDLQSSAESAGEYVSEARESVGELAAALRTGSGTPLIGDALGDFARRAESFESDLSGLTSLLADLESRLGTLQKDLRDAQESAEGILKDDMDRWLAEPYDAQWPPLPEEGTSSSDDSEPSNGREREDWKTSEAQHFSLQWEIPGSAIDVGEWITLTVRMHEVQQAGEHGGISVSFPTLTEPGGSTGEYSSSIAKVEVLDYTNGLSNVSFHQPGATIYHREDNRQFPAEYLLVESDDPSWSRSDDRTLRLRIAPLQSGEVPILVRGWLCEVQYTDCGRNPSSAADTDQQGWSTIRLSVIVSEIKTE